MVNPDGTFDIRQNTGEVFVRDNRIMDRELFTNLELVAEIHVSSGEGPWLCIAPTIGFSGIVSFDRVLSHSSERRTARRERQQAGIREGKVGDIFTNRRFFIHVIVNIAKCQPEI